MNNGKRKNEELKTKTVIFYIKTFEYAKYDGLILYSSLFRMGNAM